MTINKWKNNLMKRFLIISLVMTGLITMAEEVTVTNDYFYDDYDNQTNASTTYERYKADPSQAVYDGALSQYIYDNYGSSESMDFLNRGDAGSYNGGSDFDRNY